VRVYDEWDFRRAGFRKGWCALHELDLAPAGGDFVRRTVRTYRGPLLRIRRAFEFMRSGDRFARRQRDGDELDIDAVVEGRADVLAGLPAPEGLFVRLVRDTRDIAAIFLVDLSSSTEGWVNLAIRESLVLLCEALEVLGDRYDRLRLLRNAAAALGALPRQAFRGALRRRGAGQDRGAGARDYTRMGPPIRHTTRLLRETDAKARLLVILSDGKPRTTTSTRGTTPSRTPATRCSRRRPPACTPSASPSTARPRDYVGHLFGDVNYVVVDTSRKLPLRVPEIYRSLTT